MKHNFFRCFLLRSSFPSLPVILLLALCALTKPAFAGDGVPQPVLNSFEKFGNTWMARLDQVNRDNSLALKPENAGTGLVVGRYICYGPDCVKEVRVTGSAATPYVGILRYPQKTMEKTGENAQKMKAAPGVATNEIQVMEIFRYTGGRWVY